jgi:hypothetical protein
MNATAIATRALGTLERNGTTYTLTRQVVTANASTPWKKASSADTTQTLTGILADFTDDQRDGSIIRIDDRQYLVAASGLTTLPVAGDRITDGTDDLEIVGTRPLRAKDVTVAYWIHARQ